ncbi:glycosyltransferase family 2 protein [Brevibacillus choshinensis]|uniref:Glycosyltransferase family 2 protein n=1 Tax=Brevibacillus choshinensis TaxID=54911 RepID=A0ABX7FYC3_BRECH|nr:glycosyltransferase family 2 protein [Brevibacillus choshinensis]
MEDLIIWLLAAYGCSSLLVMLTDKWADRMSSSNEPPHEDYRLLVRDSEQVLERVIRRLLFRSYWSGKPIRISLIDSGSNEETKRISSAYGRYPYSVLLFDEGHQEPSSLNTIIIDLRQEASVQKI